MKASFSMPTSIRAGVNVVRDNADYFASLGKRALIVSTEAARLCGALDDLSAAFGEKGIEFTLFENCIPNPTTHSMLELAAFAREAGSSNGSPSSSRSAGSTPISFRSS